jgi:hypothetical protein
MAWFVVPQTAAAVLQLISSTVTVIYFGQLLGRSALAVASVIFPIFFLLVSFLIGLHTVELCDGRDRRRARGRDAIDRDSRLAGRPGDRRRLVRPAPGRLLYDRIGLDGIWIGYPTGFVIGLLAQRPIVLKF